MHEHTGTGKRRKIIVNGQRVYVVVTREADGTVRANWTMPHENRKQLSGRRISPYEAQLIKTTIQKLLKEV